MHVASFFRFTGHFPEVGSGSKDSSLEVEIVLRSLIEKLQGQKVAVLAFDCCGVVHSSLVGMYLPSLLVSLGIVETCIVLYFQ